MPPSFSCRSFLKILVLAACIQAPAWSASWAQNENMSCRPHRDPEGSAEGLVCGDEQVRLDTEPEWPEFGDEVPAPAVARLAREDEDPGYRIIGQGADIPSRFVFYHLDHLGSPRAVLDTTGARVSLHHYLPFGEERPASADPTIGTKAFTGHERDVETGMDYMLARYYSSSLGRFMSTDPAADSVEPTDPQTWNRYTYARSNPLVRVDPDGETDIYIGGGGDSRTKFVKSFARRQEGTQGRTVRYFTHKQVKEATAFANASLKNGEPLNIIGHSWGADAAVKVAAGVNGTVNTLVGVDPVDKPFGGAGERPPNVNNVVTVDAQASSPDWNDRVEAAGVCIGGKPDAFMKSADTVISVDANHGEFEKQYTAQGAGGESAKDIVDKTYQKPKE